MNYAWMDDTPVGRILIAGTEKGLHYVSFQETHFSSKAVAPEDDWELQPRFLKEPIRQLNAYFNGKLREFDVPLAPRGTLFQQQVWKALCTVPYGKTASYSEIANVIENPGAARAVGLANGQNPIAIIIPCHRIVGRSGKLTGYGGGLDRKQTLLDLEAGVRQLHPLSVLPH